MKLTIKYKREDFFKNNVYVSDVKDNPSLRDVNRVFAYLGRNHEVGLEFDNISLYWDSLSNFNRHLITCREWSDPNSYKESTLDFAKCKVECYPILIGVPSRNAKLFQQMEESSYYLASKVGECIIRGKNSDEYNELIHVYICRHINGFISRVVRFEVAAEDVRSRLFRELELDDTASNLFSLYAYMKIYGSLPEIEITDELNNKYLNAYREISNFSVDYMCNHKAKRSVTDHIDILELAIREILDKYC